MARVRDQAGFRRKQQEILDTAVRLFAELGFHQTGMAAICAAAGMSPGALYRYFPSKAAIIEAIVEAEREQTLQLIDSLGSGAGWRERLLEALDQALQEVSEPDYARLALEVAAEAARDPQLRSQIEASEAQACERLALQLRSAQAAGELPTVVDTEASAMLLLMLIDGGMNGIGAGFAALSGERRRRQLDRLLGGLLGTAE